MKKTFKVLTLIIIAAVILTMPVYAADLATSVNNILTYARGIAAGVVELGTIAGSIMLFIKRAKWGAVGTFIFGSAFAAAIGIPTIFQSIGEGIAKLF